MFPVFKTSKHLRKSWYSSISHSRLSHGPLQKVKTMAVSPLHPNSRTTRRFLGTRQTSHVFICLYTISMLYILVVLVNRTLNSSFPTRKDRNNERIGGSPALPPSELEWASSRNQSDMHYTWCYARIYCRTGSTLYNIYSRVRRIFLLLLRSLMHVKTRPFIFLRVPYTDAS